MPMANIYICAECGTRSAEVNSLPSDWFSVNISMLGGNVGSPGAGAMTEYFDTWNCLSVYAGARSASAAEET